MLSIKCALILLEHSKQKNNSAGSIQASLGTITADGM